MSKFNLSLEWIVESMLNVGLGWVEKRLKEMDEKAKTTETYKDDLLVKILYSLLNLVKEIIPVLASSLLQKEPLQAVFFVKLGINAVMEPIETYLREQADKTDQAWDDALVEDMARVRENLCNSDLLDRLIK
jgi:hypothetical protein